MNVPQCGKDFRTSSNCNDFASRVYGVVRGQGITMLEIVISRPVARDV